MTSRMTRAWTSLRWRLPFLIAAVMVAAVGTFLVFALREVRSTLLFAAATRAQSTAAQLASLLAQSTQQRLAELRLAADANAVRDYLERPSDEAKLDAQTRLAAVTSPNPQIIELWNGSGQRYLSLSTGATVAGLLPADTQLPLAPGIKRLQVYQGTLITEVVMDVTSEASAAAHGRRLGFLVVRRPVVVAGTADSLNRLVGNGASIKIGNQAGPGWTDLSKVIPAPPLERVQSGVATYQNAEGDQRLGTFAAIPGTPWVVWVDLSLQAVLAPARAFLGRMIAIALGVVIIAILLVRVMTARITTPLSDLTHASEAMADGSYSSHRVAVNRSDEIGRLGVAFNAMAERVEQSHRELEARVRRRTAKLEEAGVLLSRHVQELNDSREELNQFFALTPDMLCIADADGCFKRVNAAWHDTLGWADVELTAVPYVDFVHPDDRAAAQAETTRLRQGDITLSFENRYLCKDGSYKWLSWRAAAVASRGLIYATARDVTDQKRSARELAERAAELVIVNRELEAFSYSVSHDLRAPLRHISGFATMLLETASASLDAEGTRRLQTIVDAARRMGSLVDDLLGFSRVSRAPFSRSTVSLDEVLQKARDEVALGINGQPVVWNVTGLPTVSGDPALLHLVFVNLLSNAVKYSAPRSPAEIEIGTLATTADEAIVFVRDNGVGFDMQYAHKLFGVFQRLHRAEEFEGTGIGLANVHRIVHRHGGRVWAESAVDQGATFYVALPKEHVRC